MINIEFLGNLLQQHGFNFCTGVPCSYLKSLINYAEINMPYIPAINEGEAVSAASGWSLSGGKAIVLMQNSGLTNALSPLTSLNYIFKIPILGFVSLRGEPGIADAPQHEILGTKTSELLDICHSEHEILSRNEDKIPEQLNRATKAIESGESFFFIVKKETLSQYQGTEMYQNPISITPPNISTKPKQFPMRNEALQVILEAQPNSFLFATTGMTGRELYTISTQEQRLKQFYMMGSMGCVSSLAFGTALNTNKPIIAIDGDGALLMRMGALAMNGRFAPTNFTHILLDNSAYSTTGGQNTISTGINFAEIAAQCGYSDSYKISTLEEFTSALNRNSTRAKFIHLNIKTGDMTKIGRPIEEAPVLSDRFSKELRS